MAKVEVTLGTAHARLLTVDGERFHSEGRSDPRVRCPHHAGWAMLDVMEMSAGALHQWLNARRAAEARERAESRATCATPSESLHQAMQLIAFASRLHGWPLPDDPRSLREDQLGYTRWERLRAAWRRNGGGIH